MDESLRKSFPETFKPRIFEIVVLAICAGIIAFQLYVPPRLGVANSGDFDRVLRWRGLDYAETERDRRYFRYVNLKYKIVPEDQSPSYYKTSTTLMIWPARRLAMLTGAQYFDIRILTTLYAVLLLLSIYLILVAIRPMWLPLRGLLAAFLLFISTDPLSLSYFTSFYPEATAFAFLWLLVGCSLILITRTSSSRVFVVVYFISAAMVSAGKPQYFPMVFVFGPMGMYLARFSAFKLGAVVPAVLTGTLCLIGFWTYRQAPPMLRGQIAYDQIFLDLLVHSPTPREDLVKLGLNPDFDKHIGKKPYQANSPMTDPYFANEVQTKISALTIPLFYLRNPARLYNVIVRCSKSTFTNRVWYLGYYELDSPKPPRDKPRGLWNDLRIKLPRVIFFVGFLLSIIPALWIAIRSKVELHRGVAMLHATLVLAGASQFLIAVMVGGGEGDIVKHLFMFNTPFDVCLFLVFTALAWLLAPKIMDWRSRSTKLNKVSAT